MKHIKCIIFAFQEIFKIRQILFLDSIALFIKSCNLYFSFLAFTDKERPFDQRLMSQLKKRLVPQIAGRALFIFSLYFFFFLATLFFCGVAFFTFFFCGEAFLAGFLFLAVAILIHPLSIISN